MFVAGEDEEWGSDETEPTADTDDSIKKSTSPTVISSQNAESVASSSVLVTAATKTLETPPAEEPAPKLRLNTSLATDPALRSSTTATAVSAIVKAEEEVSVSPTPTPQVNEYFANLQSALSGHFFPLIPNVPVPVSLGETIPIPKDSSESARQLTLPVFLCTPCGIRFSSLSTLEAHQTYYCSHRVTKSPSDAEDSKTTNDAGSVNEESSGADGPSAKVARTGKQYACTHCSYSADKKVSLNRHMRMHSVSPPPPAVNGAALTGEAPPPPDLAAQIQDRYCADCDIRFSSLKTFRAHKMHYCSTRHATQAKQAAASSKAASSCTSGSGPASPTDSAACRTPPSPAAQQALLALPTNPILIVPYSLFRGASVLPAPSVPRLPNPEAPCFLMPNGTLQPMTHAITTTTSTTTSTNTSTSMTSGDVLKAANKIKEPHGASVPLDLSVRRSPELRDLVIDMADDTEKENRRSNTPEQIVCAPSLPGSPPLTPSPRPISVSPKRKHHESRSNSPRLSRSTPKSISDVDSNSVPLPTSYAVPVPSTAALHPILMRPMFNHELALRLAAELPIQQSQSPQVLVKQGVSKCKECNIVFCKHENYIAHKKHYCSARMQEEDGTASGSPPVSPTNSNGKSSPAAAQYQQLICLACGIKFTNLDNLNAHQAYYCLKRTELVKVPELEVRRCPKCKGAMEPGHQCVAPATGLKCPCCDVISSTASAAQRHLESHSGVKAYRCTICRYKGNTLRGMRTHIRMHFDKRPADLQVGLFIIFFIYVY